LDGRHISLVYDIAEDTTFAFPNERDAHAWYFSPGSLMKVPSLFYLIANGRISAEQRYICTGRFYPSGESPFRDELIHEDVFDPAPGQWYKCSLQKGHGDISAGEAIAYSCNLFFLALHEHFSKDASALQGFADFCSLIGLKRAAKQIEEASRLFCFRDRLHLSLGLPLQASVYEIAAAFSFLLASPLSNAADPIASSKAREAIFEGMRAASRRGTARGLASFFAPDGLLAKTGSGLARSDDVFKLNGWCVSAWSAAGMPRLVFVSFVQESYGAGLPLQESKRFWQSFQENL
jgi:hypothetical protein